MDNLVPRALFPGFWRPAPKAREKRPGDEVGSWSECVTKNKELRFTLLDF